MNPQIETLGDALPKEIQRCQELLIEYDRLGSVGAFGGAMIRRDIAVALKAMVEQDLPAMISAYHALEGCK